MKTSAIRRNEPCPCGSGKKFKHCCLDKENGATSGHGAAGMSEVLLEELEGRQFNSLEEADVFLDENIKQQNRLQLDDFHGLSPDQMHQILYFPFASPGLVRISEELDANPGAPILTLFELLINAIGDKGLKPTATGNLPRNFCREAALIYWGEQRYREETSNGGINREEEFSDLNVTRIVAEMAGLVRKYKGRFILSRNCRQLLAEKGLAAVYPRLFRTYVETFNWAYRDGFPEMRLIQIAFLVTLYFLTRYGDIWRPQVFYEDAFIGAFPMVLDAVPSGRPAFFSDETVRQLYASRTLVDFAGFLGLATVELVSNDFLGRKYRVKALPFLGQFVQFQLPK